MEDDAPVIYGLEFQARALTPQTAETDAIRFLVGTQSLKYDNQIHIIDFDDENNIINKNVLLHQVGEIWHISASPADKGVLATCYNKTSDSRVLACAAVWRMPKELESGNHESPDDSASTAQTLELLCHLDNGAQSSVACVTWEPMGDGKRVISLADNRILLWDLQESSSQAVLAGSAALEGKGQLRFTSGRWGPHHNCTQVATASDTTLRGWDTRSMSQIYCIENAHGQLVRDLDFNPNKQYYLASCGDDCKVKFWDTRNVTEPVKTLEEHSHWYPARVRAALGKRGLWCGASATTTLMTSWSSPAVVTAESSCPTWCPSPPNPLATWWMTTTSVTQRSTRLMRSRRSPCGTASSPPMRSMRTACTPWTGPQPTRGCLPP
ncbi:PREDICTED: protein TSSC1 isoform X2 [Dipodomys ordii]|uniref:EARP and GARP complex-interacting protein 1 n=1 Tax=Dipodomys ordii TaxID=10020 RepID=A0A1S3G8H6_DIPOR|nr:PREDICTED: protein TSSC1 isoform X2 [Dipodomys ordii]